MAGGFGRVTMIRSIRPLLVQIGTTLAFLPGPPSNVDPSAFVCLEGTVFFRVDFSRNLRQACWQIALIILLASALGIGLNLLRPDRLPFVGEWSAKARLTLPTGDHLDIALKEAEQAWFMRTAMFIDARPQDQFLLGHIEGACNLPWDVFELEFPRVMANVPKAKPIITYCDGEACGLSRELAVALRGLGYTSVRVLANGWSLWQMERLPVASGSDDCSADSPANVASPQQTPEQ